MSMSRKKNVGHSLFQQLLNHARIRGEDFNLLLSRYGIERFLYRLSVSSHANKFILKGASLFLIWKGQNYRVTRDADLLGVIPSDPENINGIFRELCNLSVEYNDGIKFMADSVRSIPIREEQAYDGIRVTLIGILHQARIPLQFDIGFGDAITPGPERLEFPTLLNAPPPKLLTYPRYTMIAEKVESVVRLGVANSRMKDFYDLWLISRLFEFSGWILCDAIRNTFNRRSTPLPDRLPMAFTKEFSKDMHKQTQWRAFVRKSKPKDMSGDFDKIISELRLFLMPVIVSVRGDDHFVLSWSKGGPWN